MDKSLETSAFKISPRLLGRVDGKSSLIKEYIIVIFNKCSANAKLARICVYVKSGLDQSGYGKKTSGLVRAAMRSLNSAWT